MREGQSDIDCDWLEKGGKLQLGKYTLGQTVTPMTAQPQKSPTTEYLHFRFELSGPNSELQSILFESMLGLGGAFTLTLGVSQEGLGWSNLEKIHFLLEDGTLSIQPN